jgi:hypothetical protein
VRRQVSPDRSRRIAALNRWHRFHQEPAFLSNKELAAHLLGYVGVDGIGLKAG